MLKGNDTAFASAATKPEGTVFGVVIQLFRVHNLQVAREQHALRKAEGARSWLRGRAEPQALSRGDISDGAERSGCACSRKDRTTGGCAGTL